MPRPMLIPPVTIGGKTSPVVANLFDTSGNFRQRTASVKRGRYDGGENGSRDGFYDLSRDPASNAPPTVPRLDVGKVRALMVKANAMAPAIRALSGGDSVAPEVGELAGFSILLLDLLNAVVEDGIMPITSPPSATYASVAGGSQPTMRAPSVPRVEPGTAELRAALAAAEKSAVVFDVDLGPVPVSNRGTLNAAFAGGLKSAALKVAGETGDEIGESIRVVNDALSNADNVEFLGQSSSARIDKRDPMNPITSPFCSMPVKLDFPDKNTRIHFERTLRQNCKQKAQMSLPNKIWKYQTAYRTALKEKYPGKVVMVRVDTAAMSLVAHTKDEGDVTWTRCPGDWPLPRGIMLPGFPLVTRVDLSPVGDTVAGGDEAMLVAATIGAESQP
jgi:hypothetical protein